MCSKWAYSTITRGRSKHMKATRDIMRRRRSIRASIAHTGNVIMLKEEKDVCFVAS